MVQWNGTAAFYTSAAGVPAGAVSGVGAGQRSARLSAFSGDAFLCQCYGVADHRHTDGTAGDIVCFDDFFSIIQVLSDGSVEYIVNRIELC